MAKAGLVVIEPFYGGSHKQFIDTAFRCKPESDNDADNDIKLYTLPAKKWHWKARTAALQLSQIIKTECVGTVQTLFASSVLNLAELIALRPDLASCKKILYFHENQLQYPVKKDQSRDFQYGYNQVLSCLVADLVLFNSHYNMNSFLGSMPAFLKLIPGSALDTKRVVSQLTPKCQVLYYAVDFPSPERYISTHRGDVLHIVWPHRWEHDKDPQTLFDVLKGLLDEGLAFKLSVVGERYEAAPEVFEEMKALFTDHIVAWGYQESKDAFYSVLASAHVVVSTAIHEFFGVAMIEAVHLGCYPLAPNALVYPEHFPEECLYNTKAQLAKKLRYFSRYPHMTRNLKVDVSKYSWGKLKEEYEGLLC